MKKIFKGSALTLLLALIMVSCSKDQALTNRISGEKWDIIGYTVNGVDNLAKLGSDPQMYFKHCTIKDTDWCSGYVSATDNFRNFDYMIAEKGEHMHLIWEPTLGAAPVEYHATISDDGKKKDSNFTFDYVDSEGRIIEYTLGSASEEEDS